MATSPVSKKRQRDEPLEKGEEPLSDKAIEELAKTGAKFDAVRVSKRQRVEPTRSLFVRSLPPSATNEKLTEFFSQHYPVKHSTVVVNQKTKESRGYGFVTFADPDDAKEAKEKLDNVEWEGRKLRLDVAEPRQRAQEKSGTKPDPDSAKEKRLAEMEEARRPAKLIIRNLPWSVKTPQDLTKLFQSFGKVKYADVPNVNGKLKGFGFVTMRRKKHAQKALESINAKEVDGRTLAVDWAVDKDVWDAQNKPKEIKLSSDDAEETGDDLKGDDKKKGEAAAKAKAAEEKAAAKAEDSKAKVAAKEKKKAKGPEAEPTVEDDVAAFMAKHLDNMESEPESDEDDLDEEMEEEDDDDKGGVSLSKSGEDVTESERPKKNLITDNSSTVFIRNLAYTVTDDQLKTFFESFGPVRYARVVVDRATDRPAGTAFVCFFNVSDCIACVKGAPRQQPKPEGGFNATRSILHDETVDPEGKYTLEGRVLQVAQAVNKDEASRLTKDGDAHRAVDKRRLFLLNEGVITPSSPMYAHLSPSEIKMRDTSLAQRKKLVQSNPTLHMSLTRLAIRNIPRNMTPKELKELARKAVVGFAVDVKEGRRQPLSKEENARGGQESRDAELKRREAKKGLIKQVKVVYETTEGTKAPMTEGSKSRGYGFIEYWSHRSALMGLRFINGHQRQDDRGKKMRLIAEFAIENAQVVNRRKMLEEKSRQPQQKKPDTPGDSAESKGASAPWNSKGKPPHKRSEGPAGASGDFKGAKGKTDRRDRQGGKGPIRDGKKNGKDAVGDVKVKGMGKDAVRSKEERAEGRVEDLQQTLMVRKRMMRKKKAGARS